MAIDQKLAVTLGNLEALPIHSPQRYSRISLDPRLAKEFTRVSSVPAETKQALSEHIVTAKWNPKSRACYGAIVDGFTTAEELSTVTGMSVSEVDAAVRELERKGVVRRVQSV